MKKPSKNISNPFSYLREEDDLEKKIPEILSQYPGFQQSRSIHNVILLMKEPSTRKNFIRIVVPLFNALLESPDPDRGLNNFERFLSAYPHKDLLYRDLIKNSTHLQWLVQFFSISQALSDALIRNPNFFDWLRDPKTHARIDKTGGILKEAKSFISDDEIKITQAIFDFKSRITLYIGLRDFMNLDSFQKTVSLISMLADTCLEMACQATWRELTERFGEPKDRFGNHATFSILGLGKLGGLELNYSSDIDLIFIYSEDGQTTGKKTAVREREGMIDNVLFFTKMAERIITILSDRSGGKAIFRVDTRLRPEGASGSLVRSLESYELYYSSLGRSWEKQAFIKARCVAGDKKLGQAFLSMIEPFVYRKYLDYKTLGDLQRIKKRIEDEVKKKGQTETHVKLGSGGIREIEFSVQMLQLLYGGKIKSLRDPNTLSCLQKLRHANLVTKEELTDLTEAYVFLRRVEHMLQLEEERQTHVLPADETSQVYLAKRLGFFDQPHIEFSLTYGIHRQKVQQFFSRIFFEWEVKGDSERILWLNQIDEESEMKDEIREKLLSFGLKDPERALEHLRLLGQSDRELPVTSEIRNIFISVLPRILNSLYAAWDPDAALSRLPHFVEKYYARKTFYELLLGYSHVVDLLVSLFGSGELLSQRLLNAPQFFDDLIGEGYLVEPFQVKFSSSIETIEKWKKHLAEIYMLEMLKIGLRYVVKMDDVRKTTGTLSLLAQEIISASASYLSRESNRPLPRLVIIGLGKLGTHELGFGSDLDLLFVCDGSPDEAFMAEDFVKKLIDLIGSNLYQIDVRLRPHGEQGALVPTFEKCKEYYSRGGELWERMALSRYRTIWGDQSLSDGLTQLLHQFVYRGGIRDKDKETFISLRDKIKRDRLLGKKGFHLKASDGSLLDIEFLIQFLSLRYLKQKHEHKHLLESIKDLSAESILNTQEAGILSSAYLFYREIDCIMRLLLGNKSEILTENSKILLPIERGLGFHQKGRYLWSEIKMYRKHITEIIRTKMG